MSYYTMGADIVELRTPGMVLAEMNTVDVLIKEISKGIGNKTNPTIQGFRAFEDEWIVFYAANNSGPGAWLSRGTTGTYNKVLEFRNRAIGWRDILSREGIYIPGPSLEKKEKRFFGLPPLAALGVFGGGAILLWYFFRERE